MELDGTTALVTGANRGIGRALVEALAAKPLARVLAGVRDPASFEPVEGARAEVEPVRLDLSNFEVLEECARDLADELEQVDLLINNAGMLVGGLLEEQDPRDFSTMIQVNLIAPAHLTQKVLPGMLRRGRGKVVNNASIGGYAIFPSVSTYNASKTGLVALSESLRRELRDTGVDVVHLVTPSVDTAILDASEAIFGRYIDTSKWQRISPAEWADVVVRGIETDEHIVLPEGTSAINRLVRRDGAYPIDPLSDKTFTRETRA